MSITLFSAIPVGAIEVLTDANGTPQFKRVDLGRYFDIVDVRHNFKNIATKPRSRVSEEGGGGTPSLLQGQNDHDALVDLEAALEIVVRSKKPKAVELVKWLTRKGVEKVVQDQQGAVDIKDMQITLLDDDLAAYQGRVR